MVLGGAILIFSLLVKEISPVAQKISKTQKDYKTNSTTLAKQEKKLQALKVVPKTSEADEKKLKSFYQSSLVGSNTEDVMAEQFAVVLKMLNENQIKTHSVKYEYNPPDDLFVINASDKYYVCSLNMKLIAGYVNFLNLLRDLYRHEYFLDISKIEISPYEKDKKMLLIDLQIKLYAENSATASK